MPPRFFCPHHAVDLPCTTSIKETRAALNKLRAKCHPDKCTSVEGARDFNVYSDLIDDLEGGKGCSDRELHERMEREMEALREEARCREDARQEHYRQLEKAREERIRQREEAAKGHKRRSDECERHEEGGEEGARVLGGEEGEGRRRTKHREDHEVEMRLMDDEYRERVTRPLLTTMLRMRRARGETPEDLDLEAVSRKYDVPVGYVEEILKEEGEEYSSGAARESEEVMSVQGDDDSDLEIVASSTREDRDREGFRHAIDLDTMHDGEDSAADEARCDDNDTTSAPVSAVEHEVRSSGGQGSPRSSPSLQSDDLISFMEGERLFHKTLRGKLVKLGDAKKYISDVKNQDLSLMLSLWYGPLDASTRTSAWERLVVREKCMSDQSFRRIWGFGKKIAARGTLRSQFERFL